MAVTEESTTILLVEDDVLMQRAVRRSLVAYGFAVTAVGTAAAALVAPKADIAVLDIDLPDLDGASLAVELLCRFRVPRIVYFTAATDRRVIARASRLGPVIRKAAGIDALVAALRRQGPTGST